MGKADLVKSLSVIFRCFTHHRGENKIVFYSDALELVRELVLSRKRANFISVKAKFAVVCGRSGENFNAG